MTTENYYGRTFNSEIPTTGVISLNEIPNQDSILWDLTYDNIDLDYENWYNELTKEEKEDDYIGENYYCDSPTLLIGDWIKNDNNEYEPNEEGKNGFSAIVRQDSGTIIQVVWSKTIKENVNHCSPCCPGQCDLTSKGIFKAYDLPKEYYKGEE